MTVMFSAFILCIYMYNLLYRWYKRTLYGGGKCKCPFNWNDTILLESALSFTITVYFIKSILFIGIYFFYNHDNFILVCSWLWIRNNCSVLFCTSELFHFLLGKFPIRSLSCRVNNRYQNILRLVTASVVILLVWN